MANISSGSPRGPKLPIRFAVMTVSNTRTKDNDKTGGWLCESLKNRGHKVVKYTIVGEEKTAIRTATQTMAHGNSVDIIITIGSTGVTDRDCVPEALKTQLDKEMDGFGELFRLLSFREVGPAAMFSRAFAGVISKTAIFCLPGSKHAVELALDRLIFPEIEHLLSMLSK